MPRTNTYAGTVFFGRQPEYVTWQTSDEAADALVPYVRAYLPSSFRALTIDSHSVAVDLLPNTYPHWGPLIDWLDTQELSESMMALLRRARVLNGVAIPNRGSGENIVLDTGDDRPADIHTLFFGLAQRWNEYARAEARRNSIPRAAILHVNTPRAIQGITITARTQIVNTLERGNLHWWAYYQAVHQLLARSALQVDDCHPSVRQFLSTAQRNAAIGTLYIGPDGAFDEWYSAEGQQRLTSVNVARAEHPDDVLNIVGQINSDTVIVENIPPGYQHWRTMYSAVRSVFSRVSDPHGSVIDFLHRALYEADQADAHLRIEPMVAGNIGVENLSSASLQLQVDELRRQLEDARAALQAIEEDEARPPAYRLVAAHARRTNEGQHVLWHATDTPDSYRLISIGEHGNADTLICYWNTDIQRWEARSDEVWVRR